MDSQKYICVLSFQKMQSCHCSVDPSLPSNLRPHVRIPSATSTLFLFVAELCCEKDENKQKRSWDKKSYTILPISRQLDTLFRPRSRETVSNHRLRQKIFAHFLKGQRETVFPYFQLPKQELTLKSFPQVSFLSAGGFLSFEVLAFVYGVVFINLVKESQKREKDRNRVRVKAR